MEENFPIVENTNQMPQNYSPAPVVDTMKKDFNRLGIGVLAMTIAIQVGAIFIMTIMMIVTRELALAPSVAMLVNAISIYGIGIPVLYLVIRKVQPAPNHLGEPLKMDVHLIVRFWAICQAGALAGNLISDGLNKLFSSIFGQAPANSLDILDQMPSKGLVFLYIVILAPVFEELIFRKLLLDRFKKYGEGFAIIVTALLFGLFHGNFNQLIYAFAIGAVLAYVAIRTHDVKWAVVIHMLVNFLGFLGYAFSKNVMDMAETLPEGAVNPQEMWVLIFGLFNLFLSICGVVFFLRGLRRTKVYPNTLGLSNGTIVKTFITRGGVIACLAVYLVLHLLTLISAG